MSKPVIHLYTVCWNEEYMIPFFFRHYDEIVDRYIIFDDGSSDNTVAMLKAHPKVEVRPLSRPEDLGSAILAGIKIYNNCWKESRGQADWVIATDMDEHMYHKDLIGYITECGKQGVTLIPGTGYQMLSRELPDPKRKLTEVITKGAPFAHMNKMGLFNPDKVAEINFGRGRHDANPTGEVVYPPTDELLILHYKYLSVESTLARSFELLRKLGKVDKEMGWGSQYSWGREELEKDWALLEANAVDNVMFLSDNHMPLGSPGETPWWRRVEKKEYFPSDDRFWMETLDAAKRLIDPADTLFAPHEFMEFFPRALPIFLLDESSLKKSAWFIFHKGEAERVGAALGGMLKAGFDAAFGNEVFVILARKGLPAQPMDFPAVHAEALWAQFEAMRTSAASDVAPAARIAKCAAVISAYNRPWALERTLPQVIRLGCPVLVVEDGSDRMHAAAYKKIREENPSVLWIAMPENRGIACAINLGISYWLADAEVEWISYFEEDVDVHPELLQRLALVQDREKRPLLTGRRPPERPAVGEEEINGVHVAQFHSTTNQHFHAHRDYWSGVLPVPAPAPAFTGFKKTGYCDWWVGSWAPESVCNTGRKIVCLPGLVSTFATKSEESSWGNEVRPDEGLLADC